MNTPKISLIAALSENRVIGKENKLPWHIPEDLKRFKKLTSGHVVIMGRKTYESIGKALPRRTNIIITHTSGLFVGNADTTTANSLEQAIEIAWHYEKQEIFIIGGGQIFKQAITFADKLYLTIVHTTINGDAFFPEYKKIFTKIAYEEKGESNGYKYTFLDLRK